MPSDAALENLARIGQLDKVPFSSELMARMLATARSRLIDAQRSENSAETRFDCDPGVRSFICSRARATPSARAREDCAKVCTKF